MSMAGEEDYSRGFIGEAAGVLTLILISFDARFLWRVETGLLR